MTGLAERPQQQDGALPAGRPPSVGAGRSVASVRLDPDPQPGAGAPAPLIPATPAQVLKLLGSVVAPLSLLTALMYYFGVAHAYWFFRRFGVEYTIFQLTTEDYLYRSADGLFVPLTALAATGLLLLWVSRLLPGLPDGRRESLVRLAVPTAAGIGAALVVVAVVGVLEPALLERRVALPGLSMATGVVLLFAASRLHASRAASSGPRAPRAPGPLTAAAEWAAVFVLVSVGLFWAAGDYSAAVGTRRGDQVLQAQPEWPDAVLYSERSLSLGLPGVREVACTRPDAAHAFRYDGLKLIVHAGGQYLFLPHGWTPDAGTAVVIPDTDEQRLEFTGPGVSQSGSC